MTEGQSMEQEIWAAFVSHAWNQPDMRAAFTTATGIEIPQHMYEAYRAIGIDPLSEPHSGLVAEAIAFIAWVTRTHWGIENAPKAYREALEGAKA